jgi:hypothetical protein
MVERLTNLIAMFDHKALDCRHLRFETGGLDILRGG